MPQPAAPTVPLSVYRELSAELQATKAMLDSLNQQNQQMARQNQQFRYEIERLSASMLNLQQLAGLPQPSFVPPMDAARAEAEAIAEQVRPAARAKAKAVRNGAATPTPSLISNKRFTEQADPLADLSTKPAPRDLSGIWLWFTVLAIIITAFGAGFMVVRPLLPGSK